MFYPIQKNKIKEMNIIRIVVIVLAVMLIYQLAFKVGFVVLVLGLGVWIGYQYNKKNKY